MKKHWKRIFVLLLVLVQLLCLCGCQALDAMRENQVFGNKDGTITWKGTVYKALPYCEYLCVDTDYDAVYVTEPDVPVLLSSMYAKKQLFVCKNGAFLVEQGDEEIYYCPVSQYDGLLARISGPFSVEKVCYAYEVYDEEAYEYRTEYYTLTEQQVAAVSHVLQQVTPTAMQPQWLPAHEFNIQLLECSEDMLLRRESLTIAVNGGSYCLFVYTDADVQVYTVPTEMASVFAEIVDVYVGFFEDLWGEEKEDIII